MMRFLVVGLGSMGKRRIRCLHALGHMAISGVDVRADRRQEAGGTYGIRTYDDICMALAQEQPDALIISVPPDLHHVYIKTALEHNLHFFVEASVVDTDMDLIIREVTARKIVAAPSATLLFHPAIRKIRDIVATGMLGTISNILHHSGQYLPDWHTYEPVDEYYVSQPETGGGREIVPFELSWLTKVFGFPDRVCGNFRKTIHIPGAEKIDDTYNMLLDYRDFLASITVDVVSRHASRRLLINGDKAQLVWDWDERRIRVYDPVHCQWDILDYELGEAAPGYNANIGESMYIEEIRSLIDAIEGRQPFPHTLEDDHRVLRLLYAIEESDRAERFIRVSA